MRKIFSLPGHWRSGSRGKGIEAQIDGFRGMIGRVNKPSECICLCNHVRQVISTNEHLWGAICLDGDEWTVIENTQNQCTWPDWRWWWICWRYGMPFSKAGRLKNGVSSMGVHCALLHHIPHRLRNRADEEINLEHLGRNARVKKIGGLQNEGEDLNLFISFTIYYWRWMQAN